MARKDSADPIAIGFNIHLPVVITPEDDMYVSQCPVLDVVTQGDTIEEARLNLIEAVSLFLATCYEMGTLETVLKDCGFVPGIARRRDGAVMDKVDYIDVPLPFVIDKRKEARCLA
jgi:predicted RNase H-like HicB family nuclease